MKDWQVWVLAGAGLIGGVTNLLAVVSANGLKAQIASLEKLFDVKIGAVSDRVEVLENRPVDKMKGAHA